MAWDHTSFGNDAANDWAYELEQRDDLSLIEETLQTVIETGDDYLGAREAEEAIAAAEVLAWLRGKRSAATAYTEKIESWVESNPLNPPAALLKRAIRVLKRIEREPSEVMEQWEGKPEWTEWMQQLRARLS